MKIYIDFSVFTETSSIGTVTGTLALAAVPEIGSAVILSYPLFHTEPLSVKGFSGALAVTHVLHYPEADDVKVMVMLDDLTIESVDDVERVMHFFEEGFNLNIDYHR
ncbi:hypothetical protein [Massilia sp. S19_KUP03_FR1]|uniref:hypothetical protein n=1 Tax=Massilia sp. S19_KUP03_FR1 TaxID=3025503 RepID=UPI002FCDC925